MCNCIETGNASWSRIHGDCSTSGEHGFPAECFKQGGRSPIVQNILNGARYCGKRGGTAFKDAVRPKYDTVSETYVCPSGHLPCNEDAPNNESTFGEYTVCRPADQTIDDFCPITSFAFDLQGVEQNKRDKYREVKLFKGGNAV